MVEGAGGEPQAGPEAPDAVARRPRSHLPHVPHAPLTLIHPSVCVPVARATRIASSTRACCSSGPRAAWPRSGASSTAC